MRLCASSPALRSLDRQIRLASQAAQDMHQENDANKAQRDSEDNDGQTADQQQQMQCKRISKGETKNYNKQKRTLSSHQPHQTHHRCGSNDEVRQKTVHGPNTRVRKITAQNLPHQYLRALRKIIFERRFCLHHETRGDPQVLRAP